VIYSHHDIYSHQFTYARRSAQIIPYAQGLMNIRIQCQLPEFSGVFSRWREGQDR
jgi:hypothetical protein